MWQKHMTCYKYNNRRSGVKKIHFLWKEENMTVALGGDDFYNTQKTFDEESFEVITATQPDDFGGGCVIKKGEKYLLLHCCLHD